MQKQKHCQDLLLDLELTRFSGGLRTKTAGGKRWIWDDIRRKWLILQPEEMVRQLLVHFFLHDKGVSRNRLAIERGLRVNELDKRCDMLLFAPDLQPWMLVECKAPKVALNQDVLRQIAIYNLPLRVPYLLVCNGPQAYCCHIQFSAETFTFLDDVPDYPRG